MQAALPVDASCEDIGIDPHLPFLDDFVGRALQNGAQPYLSRSALPQAVQGSLEAGSKHEEGALNFEAYAKPAAPQQRPMQYELPPTEQPGLDGGGGGEAGGSGLNVSRVHKKWGADGFNDGQAPNLVRAPTLTFTLWRQPELQPQLQLSP